MTGRVDAIVVGAGVIGIAVARALALAGHAPLIVEAADRFGSVTSARNSEVIHAGLYYAPGSLKASLCVEGRDRLYAYCAARGVGHRRCGKLIFAATSGEAEGLDRIEATAEAAGAGALQRLSGREAAAIEPALACAEALLSPLTGIVDSHGLMLAMLGEAEAYGAVLATRATVDRIARVDGLWTIHVDGEAVASAPILINATGLGAQALARTTEGLSPVHVPPLHLAKGSYFTYAGRVPFSRLIYPLPHAWGLGTHLTLDLAGNARFGPDGEWVDAVDYSVDPARRAAFVESARAIWPDLDPAKLQPGYAGIRPKLAGPGEPAADFVFSGPAEHGLPGLVNLFGFESPGLTASLVIGERAAAMAISGL